MMAAPVRVLWWARVVPARMHQRLGWAGLAGVALLLAAMVVLALEWSSGPDPKAPHAGGAAEAPQALAPAVPAAAEHSPPELPAQAEVAALLKAIQQAAVINGLGWPAADYRIVAATSDKPASLEVHCRLKGAYLPLRRMLTSLLDNVPAFTVREFSLSRPGTDSAEIEANLVMAVFLRDEPDRVVAANRAVRQ